MAKKTLSVSCPNCLTDYTLQARDVALASFCTFCGEPLDVPTDKLDEDEENWSDSSDDVYEDDVFE